MSSVKRVVAFLLTAIIIFSSDSVVMATNTVAPKAEQEKVIKISSVKKLLKVADDLSANYRLTKDLDLSNVKWEALGSKDEPFTGSFDGDGHTISNMHMELAELEDSFAGLFGVTDGAQIFNLAIEDMSISGANAEGIYAGAVAGKMTNSVVENCYVSGDISIEDTAVYTIGGLVGAMFLSNEASKTECCVSTCISNVEISVDEDGHGEAGELLGYVQTGVELENSYSYCDGHALVGVNAEAYESCKILSESERGKENSYVGFDFDKVWKLTDKGAKLVGQKEPKGETKDSEKKIEVDAKKEAPKKKTKDNAGEKDTDLSLPDQKNTLQSVKQSSKTQPKANSSDLTSTDGNYNYTLNGDNATITKYNGDANLLIMPGKVDGYTITGIGNGAFEGCSELEGITLPSSVTYLGSYAFRGTKISSITIPKSVEKCDDHFPYSPFAGATSLTEVIFEDGIKKVPAHICDSGSNISNIRKVVLPESIESIGYSAFYGCGNLEIVDIPKNVSSIGGNAFYGCKNLSEVVLHYNDSVVSESR